MKIAFVNQADVTATFYHSIAALSAFVKANSDHQVSLIKFKGVVNPYYFKHQIEKCDPDVIAFSSMSVHWPKVKELADLAKETSSAITICGGYHPTFAPEETIAHPTMDIICRGEGEYALLEFLNALENGEDYTAIKNLWVKKDGEIYKNEIRPLIENLDSLPFPDRDLFDYNAYTERSLGFHADKLQKERLVTVNTGKGCYFLAVRTAPMPPCDACTKIKANTFAIGRWITLSGHGTL
jgi:radical SAM superfamily enzyme YgiQ (UPF0313 family)